MKRKNIRRPSEKTLARYREQFELRRSKEALKSQKKTLERKNVEKYQNIYKKEIAQIKKDFVGASALELARIMRQVKASLKVNQALKLPKITYAKTGVASVDAFLKELKSFNKWDTYSIILFTNVVSYAEKWGILREELTRWATPIITNSIPYSNELRQSAETIQNIFYQLEKGVITPTTARDSILAFIRS